MLTPPTALIFMFSSEACLKTPFKETLKDSSVSFSSRSSQLCSLP